ncbi:LOW QUALITY PROTEIN: probable cation-transporting ATPase 13A3 [Pollicipes pollicipes]|uniref:LOW QUALITY PROTEIN: probable cation-transporting ATPase 13A3 n=1 Tax=Pollicipes pollicipes TaxID=41117 RepID=UPI001884BF7D|nr:LOW QUALITY PROTEIN: probable cation-transporting ATPase 13A3 [Pollicipes pollicipes]
MRRLRLYGENFMQIQAPSVLKLIYEQGVNPFYIMQLYSFVLWFSSGYFEFAIALIIITVLSIAIMVWEARRQTKALSKHVRSGMTVTTLRNGFPLQKSSRDLVPGEVIIMHGNCPYDLDCDVVLLDGLCVVDESALTGESHPLYKVFLPPDDNKIFDVDQNNQNIVFSGTKILQVKGKSDVLAVVIRTGFDTQKGELVRSVLFPKPVDFQFYSDFTKYVQFCILLGLLAAGYSAYAWTMNNASLLTIVLYSLDMITFVVPAILPMSLSALYGHSQRRLKRSGIYCLCSKYILLCGGVDVFCFDKTGTLTESELGFGALVPSEPAAGFSEPVTELETLSCEDPRVLTLAACHSLSLIDGEPCGDPLDLPLFNAVNWELHEQEPAPDVDFPAPVATYVRPRLVTQGAGAPADHDVAVYKQFPFTAAGRRATVLARRRFGSGLDVYVKGAPEALVEMCDPATVPANFQDVLDWYTSQGFRVVGLAWNPLDAHLELSQAENMEQEDLEAGSHFLGMVVMLNTVKAACYEPLEQLHEVNITPVMVTGDNLLTAVSVARESGLVMKTQTILRVDAELVPSSVNAAQHLRITYTSPETERSQTFLKGKFKAVHSDNYVFAIDGASFELIHTFDRSTLRTIVHRCRVFGRMAPQQKVQVIETLQDLGHQVGMCGDGCNDCGALRTAHAGLSLSPAEPSAAAPFTARTGSVACVPALICEGRCRSRRVVRALQERLLDGAGRHADGAHSVHARLRASLAAVHHYGGGVWTAGAVRADHDGGAHAPDAPPSAASSHRARPGGLLARLRARPVRDAAGGLLLHGRAALVRAGIGDDQVHQHLLRDGQHAADLRGVGAVCRHDPRVHLVLADVLAGGAVPEASLHQPPADGADPAVAGRQRVRHVLPGLGVDQVASNAVRP